MKFLNKVISAAAAVMLAATVSACAQLPRSSEIKIGPNVDAGLASDYLYYSPVGPSVDAEQVEILTGFLNAGTGPQNDYATAREYLSESFKANWNPSEQVLIQRVKPEISIYSDTSATATVAVSAEVNSQGQYVTLPTNSSRLLNFSFVRERGQWRISSAPNLTLVIKPVFDVIFRSYSLYFFDSQNRFLVPDLRWFPSRASTGTRLVNALLAGPSEWLKPAVKNAIPVGTRLATDAVTVLEGIATVNLTSRALRADVEQRQYMKAQITETLSQLGNVYDVELQIERTPQVIGVLSGLHPQSKALSPVAYVDSGLVHLAASTNTSIIGSRKFLNQVSATDFALSADEQQLAMLTPSGVYLAKLGQVGGQAKLLDARPGLLTPVFDAQGYLWSPGATEDQGIQIVDKAGKLRSFNSGWLATTERLGFGLSLEGSRAMALIKTEAGTSLYVMAVLRDSTGAPIGFGQPVQLLGSSGQIISASWIDDVDIAIMSQTASGASAPEILTIGGATRTLAAIVGGKQIIAGNAESLIFALTQDGTMYQFRGAIWNRVQDGVKALHFPGN
jgi:hypothetical protein